MMKKVLVWTLSFVLLMSGVAFAAAPSLIGSPTHDRSGVYMGIQLGYANLHYDKSWVQNHLELAGTKPTLKSTDSGFAGRAYLGYGFNQYIGAEVGYVYLPQVKWKDIQYSSSDTPVDDYFRQQVVDLFVRGTYPVDDQFSVYGKAGAGFVHRHATKNGHGSDNHTAAALGVGAAYNFTKQIYTDVSYTRYFETSTVRPVDLVLIGVGYQFC